MRRLLVFALGTALVVEPALAGNPCTPSPPPARKDGLVDLRRVPAESRARVIERLGAGDVPLVSRELLAQPAVIDQLKRARPGVVILESPEGLGAAQQLAVPVEGVAIVSGIPADAGQIRAVYPGGAPPSAANLRQMSDAVQRVQRLPLVRVQGSMAETVLREARRGDTSVALAVLAHNQEGKLRFPDGSLVEIAAVHQAAATSKRPTLLLSCDTVDALYQSLFGIGTTKRLDFASAADALRAARMEHTVGDVLRQFSRHYRSPEAKARQRVLIALVLGTVVLVLAIALARCDEKDAVCH